MEILRETVRLFGSGLADNRKRMMAKTLLMLAKLGDKQVLKDDSLIRAKLAAKVVQSSGELATAIGPVLLALETNDKEFFIDFGNCLSGKIKDSTLMDRREHDIADIVLFHPQLSARDAVHELHKRGHTTMTEDNFRMWKMRLLRARPKFDKVISRLSRLLPV